MNPEKKLEYFTEAITKEVESKKRAARRQMTTDMNAAVAQAVAEAEAEAERRIISEEKTITKAGNKQVSEAKSQARRALQLLREELTAKLFEEITSDITAFTLSNEYESVLLGSIQAAISQSKHSFTYIQLPQGSLQLGPIIQEATGLTPEPGEETDIGGFRLISSSRVVVIDCTFKSRIESAVEAFGKHSDFL
ncbi:MAG: hypothetical protein FWC77_07425 [Defluviitaleaceae bacterium]|nr:hypothetical protein [Defluviitaleaceae bacterium]